MMSSGVRGQDCGASTTGAASGLTIKPDIIRLDLLVQMQNCRETKAPKPETHNGSFSVKLSSLVLLQCGQGVSLALPQRTSSLQLCRKMPGEIPFF